MAFSSANSPVSPREPDLSSARAIRYNLPLIPQTTDASCWSAALQMVKAGRRLRRPLCTADRVADDLLLQRSPHCMFATGAGGNWLQVYGDADAPPNLQAFAAANDLVFPRRPTLGWSLLDIERMLETYGPLWVAGMAQGSGHAFVISGCAGDGSQKRLRIHDPWPPNEGTVCEINPAATTYRVGHVLYNR